MNFLRSFAGAELTEFWEKEVRVLFEATREGEVDVPAHTYEQVVENTKQTLLKLVSKDRAIIDLLRMEQGSRGFKDFLADVDDQMHLCHSWETLTQACIFNTPTASCTMLQSDECWVSLWRIMAFPHIYDVSHSKFHELGQN